MRVFVFERVEKIVGKREVLVISILFFSNTFLKVNETRDFVVKGLVCKEQQSIVCSYYSPVAVFLHLVSDKF